MSSDENEYYSDSSDSDDFDVDVDKAALMRYLKNKVNEDIKQGKKVTFFSKTPKKEEKKPLKKRLPVKSKDEDVNQKLKIPKKPRKPRTKKVAVEEIPPSEALPIVNTVVGITQGPIVEPLY